MTDSPKRVRRKAPTRPLTVMGKAVKKALIDAGLTQREFCKQHGIDHTLFSRIMHEDYTYLTLRERIISLLNLNMDISA